MKWPTTQMARARVGAFDGLEDEVGDFVLSPAIKLDR